MEGMEGRDIKRIILGLVSLTCYAGPVRPARIYTAPVAALRAVTYVHVQKANGHPFHGV